MLIASKSEKTTIINIFIATLPHNVFSAKAQQPVKSFLTDRFQQINIKGNVSRNLSVLNGVPQGAVVGPTLYSIYTSYFISEIKHCSYNDDDTQTLWN